MKWNQFIGDGFNSVLNKIFLKIVSPLLTILHPPLFIEDRPAFRIFVPAVFTPPFTFCLEVPLLVWLLEETVFFVVVTAFFAALLMADAAPDFTADLEALGLAAAFFPAAAIFAAVPLIQAWPLGSVRFTGLFPV